MRKAAIVFFLLTSAGLLWADAGLLSPPVTEAKFGQNNVCAKLKKFTRNDQNLSLIHIKKIPPPEPSITNTQMIPKKYINTESNCFSLPISISSSSGSVLGLLFFLSISKNSEPLVTFRLL